MQNAPNAAVARRHPRSRGRGPGRNVESRYSMSGLAAAITSGFMPIQTCRQQLVEVAYLR
jgi:hypothetical protein